MFFLVHLLAILLSFFHPVAKVGDAHTIISNHKTPVIQICGGGPNSGGGGIPDDPE